MTASGLDTRNLEPGRFFGLTVGARRVPGMSLSEICYPPGLAIPRHDHELASICFVLTGAYDERYGNRHRTGRQGMVILHPEGEHHANTHHDAPVRLLSVEIEGARLASLREAAPVLAEAVDHAGGEIARLAMSLTREFRGNGTASALAIEALVLEILVACCRRETDRDAVAPAWLARADAFLRDRFAQPLTLSDVARAAGVHSAHLARTFRRHHGHSVAGHIRRLRLEAAHALLREKAPSLAEIADACGFSDQSHFTRHYRAAYGVTPAVFRRERQFH
jgi:AraC family transcriptional regulator